MMIVQIAGEDKSFAPRSKMVETIATILKENGECTEHDLKAKGFTSKEIERHWSISYALARVKLNWLDG